MIIKACLCLLLLWSLLATAQAQTTVIIYQDNFESGITGWSNNDQDFSTAATNFLGRFANDNETTSRTFTVPANATEVTIAFDLLRFDSWDNSE